MRIERGRFYATAVSGPTLMRVRVVKPGGMRTSWPRPDLRPRPRQYARCCACPRLELPRFRGHLKAGGPGASVSRLWPRGPRSRCRGLPPSRRRRADTEAAPRTARQTLSARDSRTLANAVRERCMTGQQLRVALGLALGDRPERAGTVRDRKSGV